MSIASKLQDILAAKADIKAAIAGKGGTITDATPLDEYATAVQSIPSGDDLIKLIDRTITSIDIPYGTTTIGRYSFYYCNNLTSITIPNTVTSTGVWCFAECHSLTSIVLPTSMRSLASRTFHSCINLVDVTLNDGLNFLGDSCFYNTKMTYLRIPDTVTTIGINCFHFCYLIRDVDIGTGITSIGNNFMGNSRQTNGTIIVRAVIPPTLGTSFLPTNFAGKIYVPDASVEVYKTATNWSTWAAYIYPLSDYQP